MASGIGDAPLLGPQHQEPYDACRDRPAQSRQPDPAGDVCLRQGRRRAPRCPGATEVRLHPCRREVVHLAVRERPRGAHRSPDGHQRRRVDRGHQSPHQVEILRRRNTGHRSTARNRCSWAASCRPSPKALGCGLAHRTCIRAAPNRQEPNAGTRPASDVDGEPDLEHARRNTITTRFTMEETLWNRETTKNTTSTRGPNPPKANSEPTPDGRRRATRDRVSRTDDHVIDRRISPDPWPNETSDPTGRHRGRAAIAGPSEPASHGEEPGQAGDQDEKRQEGRGRNSKTDDKERRGQVRRPPRAERAASRPSTPRSPAFCCSRASWPWSAASPAPRLLVLLRVGQVGRSEVFEQGLRFEQGFRFGQGLRFEQGSKSGKDSDPSERTDSSKKDSDSGQAPPGGDGVDGRGEGTP